MRVFLRGLLLASIMLQLTLPISLLLGGKEGTMRHAVLHELSDHAQGPLQKDTERGHLPETPFCPSLNVAVTALPTPALPAQVMQAQRCKRALHLLRVVGSPMPGWDHGVWHPPTG